MDMPTPFQALMELVSPADQDSPDFQELEARFPWVQAMAECPQSPRHHGEGDVWAHTRMVMSELMDLASWPALAPEIRDTLMLAALFHDVGKPDTTAMEDGEWRSPGHSRRGEILTRRILWELGAPLPAREAVAQLTRFHQKPFWLFEANRPERVVREISWCVRPDLLWHLSAADA